MNLSEVIFIDSLPKIDLHGLDRDTARVFVNDFVNDHYKMKNEIIVIVHGVGSQILKKETHNTLKNNKLVITYQTFIFNAGCTIVKLDLTKAKKML